MQAVVEYSDSSSESEEATPRFFAYSSGRGLWQPRLTRDVGEDLHHYATIEPPRTQATEGERSGHEEREQEHLEAETISVTQETSKTQGREQRRKRHEDREQENIEAEVIYVRRRHSKSEESQTSTQLQENAGLERLRLDANRRAHERREEIRTPGRRTTKYIFTTGERPRRQRTADDGYESEGQTRLRRDADRLHNRKGADRDKLQYDVEKLSRSKSRQQKPRKIVEMSGVSEGQQKFEHDAHVHKTRTKSPARIRSRRRTSLTRTRSPIEKHEQDFVDVDTHQPLRTSSQALLCGALIAVLVALGVGIGIGIAIADSSGIGLHPPAGADNCTTATLAGVSLLSTITTPTAPTGTAAVSRTSTAAYSCTNGASYTSVPLLTVFTEECNVDYPVGDQAWNDSSQTVSNLNGAVAFTFPLCMDLCAQYNSDRATTGPHCEAVTYWTNLSISSSGSASSNCWFKDHRGVPVVSSPSVDYQQVASAYITGENS